MQSSLPLLGRIGEREILEQLVADVRGGRSAALIIRGETGIGKTALLRHLVAAATGFRVLRAAGVESEKELPFAGLHELCAPLLGRLERLAEPQRRAIGVAFGLTSGETPDRFLLAVATLSLLADTAEQRPLLCVVDDAQWLDDASAQVLGFVGRRLPAEPIALVLAARTPVAEPDHLAGLPELLLDGLDAEPAAAVLATVAAGPLDASVRARIIEETHGNPLALLELGRGAAAELAGGFALPDARDVPHRIEEQYVERISSLSADAQRLVLLAAADPVGESPLVLRAAHVLGLDMHAVDLAASAGLLDVGANVRFRHAEVRSAAYRAAPLEDRLAVHGALAAASDAAADPDRRAWHRAHATTAPDESVASELVDAAERARRRGAMAAAAAFQQRAVALTPDLAERARRAVAAAEAKYAAGDLTAAQALLALAEIGPLNDIGAAHVEHMRAQVELALKRGRDAPRLLLRAAQRLQPLDVDLARLSYVEALVAAIYAGRLADGHGAVDIARAAMSAPLRSDSADHAHLLLHGLALRVVDGHAAAAATLKQALRRYRAQPRELDWLSVAYDLVAMDLCDDAAWLDLAAGQARVARGGGNAIWLRFALDHLAEGHLHAGELDQADALLVEAERIDPGIRTAMLPYVPLLLAAWRGDARTATRLVAEMSRGALAHGEGAAITCADYATAVLCNGLGQYERAAEAAQDAAASGELVFSTWALAELVEAAARSDRRETAWDAADRLFEIARASESDWACGAAARARALLSDGDAAEDLHREAVDLLARTRMAAHLARARLSYGEWLRRENRRVEARTQLRPAFEAFTAMGIHEFGERARRELQATGEKARKRNEETRDALTAQEEEIARLAREGRTNPEIGARLFISARTVEWHLRKVFAKLDISSRRDLDRALGSRSRQGSASLGGQPRATG